jgi:hypothetical protein
MAGLYTGAKGLWGGFAGLLYGTTSLSTPPGLLADTTSTFTPAQLFAQGEPGAWYDPSDFSTLFQDVGGKTPVTAVEQSVGLMIDKSAALTLGPELATAPDLSWNGSAGIDTAPICSVTSGKMYVMSWTGLSTTAVSTVNIRVDTTAVIPAFGPTTATQPDYTTYFVAPATGTLQVYASANALSVGSYATVSVKEVLNMYAYQGTSGSRPVVSARKNLILNSLLAGGVSGTPGTAPTSWTQTAISAPVATYVADPEAANGYYVTVAVNSSSRLFFFQTPSVLANTTYTLSVIADFFTTAQVGQVVSFSAAPAGATVTFLIDGVPTSSGTTNITHGRHTVCAVLTVGATAGTAQARWGLGIASTIAAATVTFRKIQFEQAATRTSYQWISTATSYDTTGFPVFLKFDGTDDSLLTNTSTIGSNAFAQMFAGVRKSAAVTAMAAEFGNTAATNGSISLYNQTAAGWGGNSRGTAEADNNTATGYAPAISNVLTVLGDIAGPSVTLRANGSNVVTSTATQGTGNYGNGNILYIGRRTNSTLPFNGNLYGLILRFSSSAMTARQIAETETWMNGKTQAY